MIKNTDIAAILQIDADLQALEKQLQNIQAMPQTALTSLTGVRGRILAVIANETALSITNLQQEVARLQAVIQNRPQ